MGSAKSLAANLLPTVLQCLSHSCHGVRLAAVACLISVATVDGTVVSSTIDTLVRPLAHIHGHITSPAVIAATAATAFAASNAASKPLSRAEKLKQSLRLGKTKDG